MCTLEFIIRSSFFSFFFLFDEKSRLNLLNEKDIDFNFLNVSDVIIFDSYGVHVALTEHKEKGKHKSIFIFYFLIYTTFGLFYLFIFSLKTCLRKVNCKWLKLIKKNLCQHRNGDTLLFIKLLIIIFLNFAQNNKLFSKFLNWYQYSLDFKNSCKLSSKS